MYCTKQDLIERFGIAELEAKAWDQDLDTIDDAKVDQACQDATETVNLYVSTSITLPAETPPPILVRLSCDIARYFMQSQNPLDEAKERYRLAIRILKDIAAGNATINVESEPTQPANVDAQRDESDRIFTRESLADF